MLDLPHSLQELLRNTFGRNNAIDSLHSTVAHLIVKKFSLAVTTMDKELKSLLSCQIFDLLDWARRKLPADVYGELEQRVLLSVENPLFQFKTMELFEEYIEEILVNGEVEVELLATRSSCTCLQEV